MRISPPDNSKMKRDEGTSLAVQWLRLRASSAGRAGSIPGGGTKIPHAVQRGGGRGGARGPPLPRKNGVVGDEGSQSGDR